MTTYKHINHELELRIRRGFSSDLEKFKALKGWMDGAFLQMVSHNKESMYSFSSRVKQVESLLKKFDGKIQDEFESNGNKKKWSNIESYGSLKNEMDDLIGGRLISFFISDLPKTHDYLKKFKRFFIEEVTIHDMKDNSILIRPILRNVKITDNNADAILNEVVDKDKTNVEFRVKCDVEHEHQSDHVIPYQVRMNTNGYVGVHMIIKPLTYDDYWNNEPKI